VRRILRDATYLKTLPSVDALTPQLIEQTSAALCIDPADFRFGSMPLAPHRLLPGAQSAVAAAATHQRVIMIANISVFAEPGLGRIREGLAPHLAAIHTSWRMGVSKPDHEAFRIATAAHVVAVRDLAHIGNSWTEDVAPVLALGGRAVWINQPGQPSRVPSRSPRSSPQAFAAITTWSRSRCGTGRARAHVREGTGMSMSQVLVVYSFGFNYGTPPALLKVEPEVLIDARCLINPYKLPEFHDLSGLDAPTREFVLEQPKAQDLLATAEAGLASLLGDPLFPVLRVAFGCTGGKDRSVSLADEFAGRALRSCTPMEVFVRHLHVHLRGGADRRGYDPVGVATGVR
jgi:hypothetical protein